MEYVEISLQVTHEAYEAVSQLFIDLGAKGTVIDDPELVNRLRHFGGWQLTDIAEQKNMERVTVTAYYPDDFSLAVKLNSISEGLDEIGHRIGSFRFGELLLRRVKEQDWANEWKQYFHVTHVGQSLVICPSWEHYQPKVGEHVITIDPGMAFGTGTHHTTNMMMERLEKLLRAGDKVIDVGTGSGILAITSALLGAQKVQAVDIDPVAVEVAKENVDINNLTDRIKVREGDLLQGTVGLVNVITANIIADIIIDLTVDVPKRLVDGGYFIASGIIEERMRDVELAGVNAGLSLETVDKRGGWVVMTFIKKGSKC